MSACRAISSFAVFRDGAPFMIQAGDLFDENDPIVLKRPTLFTSVDRYVATKPAASIRIGRAPEDTTAEPGVSRSVVVTEESLSTPVKPAPKLAPKAK